MFKRPKNRTLFLSFFLIIVEKKVDTILMTIQDNFNHFCEEYLPLTEKDMKYYSSLPLCALDAIYSIQLKYDVQVVPVVKRMCEALEIEMLAKDPTEIPPVNEQTTVSSFIQKLKDKDLWDAEKLTSITRTYKTAGSRKILKSDAFIQFLDVLVRNGIDSFQDLNSVENQYSLGMELRTIKGQKESVNYFFMLAGDKYDVKVDTHLTRFAQRATGENHLTYQQIKDLYKNAAIFFSTAEEEMTPRHFDHIVWNWQRNPDNKNI